MQVGAKSPVDFVQEFMKYESKKQDSVHRQVMVTVSLSTWAWKTYPPLSNHHDLNPELICIYNTANIQSDGYNKASRRKDSK